MAYLLFFFTMGTVYFDMTFSQGEICGSPPLCYCFNDSPYVIDCGLRGLDICPAFDMYTQRMAFGLILSGNDITEIPEGYFTNWYTLTVLNLEDNPRFDCKSLRYIPEWVSTVLTDCPTVFTTSPVVSTTGESIHFFSHNFDVWGYVGSKRWFFSPPILIVKITSMDR